MGGIKYHSSSLVDKSWYLVPKWMKRHFTIDFGFWIRKTTDHPFQHGTGFSPRKSTYLHESLLPGQIRLLLLEPGPPAAPLTGSLKTVSLKEAIANGGFEAISYVWGRDEWQTSIHLGSGHVRIPPSAVSALTHFRNEAATRAVWIDSVCIDQENTMEKSEQVQLMADIFSSASRVLAWLGPSSKHSGVGMEILRHFASAEPFDDAARWRVLSQQLVREGLQDIMQRPWWYRHWIVQEASLAKSVVLFCGSDTIAWRNKCTAIVPFMRAVKIAVLSPQWEQVVGLANIDLEALLNLLQMQLYSGPQHEIWRRRREGADFLDMAFSMRRRQATDPRDKVYSFIGIAARAIVATPIVPDYRKPAEAVFLEFAQIVTMDTERLCAELGAIEAQDHGDDGKSAELDIISPKMEDGQSAGLEAFMQNMCEKAIEETKNGHHANAAKLLSDMALLLRGESHQR